MFLVFLFSSFLFPLSASIFLFFFFSSRRRHPRWPPDWSSDVCSSDLLLATIIAVGVGTLVSLIASRRPRTARIRRLVAGVDAAFMLPLGVSAVTVGFGFLVTLNRPRSEERRGGKGAGGWAAVVHASAA